MKKILFHSLTLVLLSAGAVLAEDKIALQTKLPDPLFVGTPVPILSLIHI